MLLSRRGQDGRLSLATFVRRKSASLPLSVANEARLLQVEDSQEVLQHAIMSFGRSKLISIAAHSLDESRPPGAEADAPSESCSEERLAQAKVQKARHWAFRLPRNLEGCWSCGCVCGCLYESAASQRRSQPELRQESNTRETEESDFTSR